MAVIRLRRRDTGRDDLPQVCMACGQPAIDHIRKTFSWHPPWVIALVLVGLLVYVIVALVLTKRRTVDVPVCEQHRGYFWKRNLVMWLPLILLFLLGMGLLIALSGPRQGDTGGLACGACAVLGVLWLIVAVVINQMMIRPTQITDTTVTLTRVHDEFASALETSRRLERYDDDDDDRPRRRPRRRLPREDDDIDDLPRRDDSGRDEGYRAERDRRRDDAREPPETGYRKDPPRRRDDDD